MSYLECWVKAIEDVVGELKKDFRCKVFPVKSMLPILPCADLKYPSDLECFYSVCGGALLFETGKDNVSFEVLPPGSVGQSNLIILGDECCGDISSAWYVICKDDNGSYISIDLSLERNGQCYDSNYEIHGVPGSCPIIARSFSELLINLYSTNGMDVYWSEMNHGDAYGNDF